LPNYPRLKLTPPKIHTYWKIFFNWFTDPKEISRIVKTFSLQAMFDLAQFNPQLADKTKTILNEANRSKTPSIRSRAKKLLKAE